MGLFRKRRSGDTPRTCNEKVELVLRRYDEFEMTAREMIAEIRLIMYDDAHSQAHHEEASRDVATDGSSSAR